MVLASLQSAALGLAHSRGHDRRKDSLAGASRLDAAFWRLSRSADTVRLHQSRWTHRHRRRTRFYCRYHGWLPPCLRHGNRQGVVESPASRLRQRHAYVPIASVPPASSTWSSPLAAILNSPKKNSETPSSPAPSRNRSRRPGDRCRAPIDQFGRVLRADFDIGNCDLSRGGPAVSLERVEEQSDIVLAGLSGDVRHDGLKRPAQSQGKRKGKSQQLWRGSRLGESRASRMRRNSLRVWHDLDHEFSFARPVKLAKKDSLPAP